MCQPKHHLRPTIIDRRYFGFLFPVVGPTHRRLRFPSLEVLTPFPTYLRQGEELLNNTADMRPLFSPGMAITYIPRDVIQGFLRF